MYAFLDGDASEVVDRLADLIGIVERGEARLVLGIRDHGNDRGAMPWQQRWGNRAPTLLLNRLSGAGIGDLSSLKVIEGPWLRSLDLRERSYGWTAELIARAAFGGVAIAQVATGMRRRRGLSKVSGSISNSVHAGCRICCTIVRVWREERR